MTGLTGDLDRSSELPELFSSPCLRKNIRASLGLRVAFEDRTSLECTEVEELAVKWLMLEDTLISELDV